MEEHPAGSERVQRRRGVSPSCKRCLDRLAVRADARLAGRRKRHGRGARAQRGRRHHRRSDMRAGGQTRRRLAASYSVQIREIEQQRQQETRNAERLRSRRCLGAHDWNALRRHTTTSERLRAWQAYPVDHLRRYEFSRQEEASHHEIADRGVGLAQTERGVEDFR